MATTAVIAESYFEYKASLSAPMFKAWTLPNTLVADLFPALKQWDVGLSDISCNKESNSLQDLQLTFNVLRLGATIKVGLDSISCVAVNPDWSQAPALVELYGTAIQVACKTGATSIASHECALAMHVRSGDNGFKETMANLVNGSALGPAQMYGLSIYQNDSSMVLDRSVRYENGLFVRLYRKLSLGVDLVQVAKMLYDDEVKALTMLGLPELLEGSR